MVSRVCGEPNSKVRRIVVEARKMVDSKDHFFITSQKQTTQQTYNRAGRFGQMYYSTYEEQVSPS